MSVTARDHLLSRLRAMRPELERLSVTGMALYGSRARNEHRPDSDIDLLIEIAEGQKFSLLDLAGVGQTIEDRLGLTVDVKLQRSLSGDLRDRISSQAISVFACSRQIPTNPPNT